MASERIDRPLRLLHVFATFDAGGPQVRTVEVIGRLGAQFTHAVIAADGRTGAAARLPAGIAVETLRRPASALQQARALVAATRTRRPDLVLTYNWGAMLGAAAARWLGVPFVHHEEVVPVEEHAAPLQRREWLRRLVLPRAAAVVVPSRRLADAARSRWAVPPARVDRIDNGVELAGRRAKVHAAGRSGHAVVGTVAHARPEKNWPRLLHAFAQLRAREARLLVVGDGPGRPAAEQLAGWLGVGGRVRFAGAVDEARPCYDAMDVFALASDDEQMPLAVLEAMAHGLPVVATDVGEVAAMLPPAQRRFVVPADARAAAAMAAAIDELLADAPLRARLGAENRAHAERRHDLAGVAARYAALYRRCARPAPAAAAQEAWA